jgi:hypothetical protein
MSYPYDYYTKTVMLREAGKAFSPVCVELLLRRQRVTGRARGNEISTGIG